MSEGEPALDWSGHRVLVTGCTGLVGRRLVRLLEERGASVVGLARRANRVLSHTHVMRGDVAAFDEFNLLVSERSIETIFHLAAQTQVRVALERPLETFQVNVGGVWNVLEASRRAGRRVRVVLATSLPGGPGPYATSKTCGEMLLHSYRQTYDVPACAARCSQIFGPGDANSDRIIPETIRTVLRAEPPVIRSDGRRLLDLLYVDDAALAFLRLAELMDSPRGVRASSVVRGEQRVSVREVVQMILRLMERTDLEPICLGEELPSSVETPTDGQDLPGWAAEVGLEEGLRRTIAWFRARPHETECVRRP